MALVELIYTSLSRALNENNDVKDILATSERNNAATSVTGLLLFDGERYIQILEGESQNVEGLFDAIQNDPRHHDLELLHKGNIAGRSFQSWRMAYETLPKGLLEDLAENMAVFSLNLDDEPLSSGESFGARLNAMFIDAIAAE
jgi:hypothetical protein